MARENLIGRAREIEALRQCVASDRSEFVIVYGRRRVGKTFLVDEFFDCKYDFTFVGGHNQSRHEQLRNFAKTLARHSGAPRAVRLTDWEAAFDALENYLMSLPAGRKKVVFIDEMPWIDTVRSEFVTALENFWNGWAARRRDILFIASGSSSSWMFDKLVENPGGLHARITRHIYLRPFTLGEVEQYLTSRGCLWDRFQITQCYMFFGGVPFYLSLLDPGLSLMQNVDRLCFERGGALQLEFDELYNALFANAESYVEVVRTLARHRNGMTQSEIATATKMQRERLSRVLTNLERCDFVMRFNYYGRRLRDRVYRLSDFYTLFYLKFIEPNLNSFDNRWWSTHFDSPSVTSWQGLSFELVSLAHIDQIRRALGISGVATEVSAWFDKGNADRGERGAQIDLIIERADRVIHLCEMKFSQEPYRISKDYEMSLRERMGLFRARTHTAKSLVNTFVTTFGVASGLHSSIVHSEVTLDGLFQ